MSEGLSNTEIAALITEAICRRFEGLRLKPYLCPAGIPTIGYGSIRYLDGRAVRLTDPSITQDQALTMLKTSIQSDYLPAAMRLCPVIDTPERLAAVTDFIYNLGVSRLKSSTLRKRINARMWQDVPGELKKWVHGGGRVLPGLTARRDAEIELI